MKKTLIITLSIFSFLVVTAQGKFGGGDGSGYSNAEFNTGTPSKITSTNDLSLKPYKVYPNPASDVVNFEIPASANTVILYNSNGVKVLGQEGSAKLTIDLTSLNKGLYFYQIKGETVTYNGKLLVH